MNISAIPLSSRSPFYIIYIIHCCVNRRVLQQHFQIKRLYLTSEKDAVGDALMLPSRGPRKALTELQN